MRHEVARNLTFQISTHAPAWDATRRVGILPPAGTFQLTHPRGVRLIEQQIDVVSIRFQLTHPMRDTTVHSLLYSLGHEFQVPPPHAMYDANNNVVSPPPLYGTTRDKAESASTLFQLTHPHGVRLVQPIIAMISIPTPRVGCDYLSLKRQQSRFAFQLTHPRGVRQYRPQLPS